MTDDELRRMIDSRIEDRMTARFGDLASQWLDSIPARYEGRCEVGTNFTEAVNKVLRDGGPAGPETLQGSNNAVRNGQIRGNGAELQRDPGDVIEDAVADAEIDLRRQMMVLQQENNRLRRHLEVYKARLENAGLTTILL